MLHPPDLTTREMIDLLREFGYVVVRKEQVREYSAQHVLDDQILACLRSDAERAAVRNMVENDSAMQIGLSLLREGAIEVKQERNEYEMRSILDFRVRVILPQHPPKQLAGRPKQISDQR